MNKTPRHSSWSNDDGGNSTSNRWFSNETSSCSVLKANVNFQFFDLIFFPLFTISTIMALFALPFFVVIDWDSNILYILSLWFCFYLFRRNFCRNLWAEQFIEVAHSIVRSFSRFELERNCLHNFFSIAFHSNL